MRFTKSVDKSLFVLLRENQKYEEYCEQYPYYMEGLHGYSDGGTFKKLAASLLRTFQKCLVRKSVNRIVFCALFLKVPIAAYKILVRHHRFLFVEVDHRP